MMLFIGLAMLHDNVVEMTIIGDVFGGDGH